MKVRIQSLLRRVGLYERLKASHAYDLYWSLSDRRVISERRREVAFYRHVLEGFRGGDLIFDIGANHGTKTDIFLRLGARVIAVEPDETNQEILRQRFLSLRLWSKPVTIVGKAVSDAQKTETMWVDRPGSAKNTLSEKWVATLRRDSERFGDTFDFSRTRVVQTDTLEHLIEVFGLPFFTKIDVEGFEPSVIRGLKRRVRYLSFEVNLPEFRPEGFECIRLLNDLCPQGEFNFVANCDDGLAMKSWTDAETMAHALGTCADPSIEIFCRTRA